MKTSHEPPPVGKRLGRHAERRVTVPNAGPTACVRADGGSATATPFSIRPSSPFHRLAATNEGLVGRGRGTEGSRDHSTEIIRRFAAAHPTPKRSPRSGSGKGLSGELSPAPVGNYPAAARYVGLRRSGRKKKFCSPWLPDRLRPGARPARRDPNPGRPAPSTGGRTVLTDAKLRRLWALAPASAGRLRSATPSCRAWPAG